MILGIDFDRVLFDTDAFDQRLKEEVEGFHHTEEEPFDMNGNYSPEKHAEILGIPVERIYDGVRRCADEFLYPDIEKLEEIPAEVVIVTRGEEKFQRLKIENSGVLEYIDSYMIVEQGDKQVDGIDLLVDDWEEEIEKVDIPGFLFDRQEHDLEDVAEWVKEHAA